LHNKPGYIKLCIKISSNLISLIIKFWEFIGVVVVVIIW
jgi:hypothetical protein